MKTILAFFAVQMAFAQLSAVACPVQGGHQTYALWCRGPLSMMVQGGAGTPGSTALITLIAYKNSSSAGNLGEKLYPSSCAWVDRPLNQAEPNRLTLGIASTTSMVTFGAINTCAGNPKCAFLVCAYNDPTRGALFAPNDFTNTNYPGYSN